MPILANMGPAPELTNQIWLNSDGQPLHLATLRGRVVALEFWTFDCINCQHVIPALKDWFARYQSKGFTVIADHFPEFGYEADPNNLTAAVARLGITYPVAQDNDGSVWNAYQTQYWPTLHLIDKRGNLRFTHIGEGGYDETETAIRALLAEPGP